MQRSETIKIKNGFVNGDKMILSVFAFITSLSAG